MAHCRVDNSKSSLDIEKAYNENKYIMFEDRIYQPFYSVNAGYYAQIVYRNPKGMYTLRGRFFHFTGEYINKIIGFDLLNNL